MKSVLISIQPKWCAKIASGAKTIEVRKTAPKIATPFKCYIYETQGATEMPWMDEEGHMIFRGRGMIIGEFVCDFIEPVSAKNRYIISKLSCVPLPDLYNYAGAKGLEGLKGWHISDLVIYDKPKELYEFYKCGAATVEELDKQLCNYCVRTDYGEHRSSLTPNGYWSCEGAWCDEAYREYLDTEYVLTRPPQSWCYVERGNDNA